MQSSPSDERKVQASAPSRRGDSAESQRAFTKIKLKRTVRENNDQLLSLCRTHTSQMTLVDTPEVKLEVKGPQPLYWDSRSTPRQLEYLATQQSLVTKAVIRSLFKERIYSFRLSTALNMSSSAAGIVNSTINMATVQSSTDFTSIAQIFQEFFIIRCDAHWMPNNRYNYQLTGGATPATTISSLPVGCAQLQNAAVPYSSLSSLSNNFGARYHNTCDPFTFSWVNVTKPSTTLETTTSGTQGWCDTNSGQLYTGAMQFLSQSPPPALPASQVLGTFMTHWELLFRVRE